MRAQEVTIRVQLVDHPTFYPAEIWELNLDRVSLSADEVLDILAEIPWAGNPEFPASYELSGRQGALSWGASGSFGEFILQVSSSGLGGVGTVAVASAIKAAFAKIRSSAEGETLDSLSDEPGALSIARSRITQHYGVEEDALALLRSEVSVVASSYEFEFRHADGRTFGVEIKEIEGVKACVRLSMESQDPITRPEYRTPDNGN